MYKIEKTHLILSCAYSTLLQHRNCLIDCAICLHLLWVQMKISLHAVKTKEKQIKNTDTFILPLGVGFSFSLCSNSGTYPDEWSYLHPSLGVCTEYGQPNPSRYSDTLNTFEMWKLKTSFQSTPLCDPSSSCEVASTMIRSQIKQTLCPSGHGSQTFTKM